eukprot:5697846-Heterocapsa_arctica.AAC.1
MLGSQVIASRHSMCQCTPCPPLPYSMPRLVVAVQYILQCSPIPRCRPTPSSSRSCQEPSAFHCASVDCASGLADNIQHCCSSDKAGVSDSDE